MPVYQNHFGFEISQIRFVLSMDNVESVRLAIVDMGTLEGGESGVLLFEDHIYKPFERTPPTMTDMIVLLGQNKYTVPEPAACERPDSLARMRNVIGMLLEGVKDGSMTETALKKPLKVIEEPSCINGVRHG